MAESPAPRTQAALRGRSTLAPPIALLAGGSVIAGAGLAWLPSAGGVGLAVAVLGAGGAALGGLRLWRAATALDQVATEITTALDANLLPGDIQLPAQTPLAPLARTVVRMGREVRHLVQQLQMQADQVRDIALHIGQAAARHDSDAASQAAAVSQVASAMAELERTIAHVMASTQEVAHAADEVLTASTSSSRVVADAVSYLDASRQRVSETLAAIEALRAQANEIGTISELIGRIADDVHILALNAAIEAAGAGDAGLRFGVVAAEVRTLAQSTRRSNQEVRTLLAELEAAMTATVGAARAGLEQTGRSAELTNTLSSTATQLTATAQHTQYLAATIAAAMVEQRNSAAEIVRAVTHIAGSATQMRAATSAMASEATDLIDVSQALRGSALHFGMKPAPERPLRLLIAGRETVSSRGLAWRALVDAWNQEHPTQAIAIEFIPPGDYIPELARTFATGGAPDIVQVPNGTQLARQGYLAPLDDLLSPAVRADFYPALLDAACVEGRIYSLPTEAQPLILFYNKGLFAELGIDVPNTWDEWIAAAARCQTEQRAGIMFDTGPGDYRSKQWLSFAWQGGDVLGEDGTVEQLATPAVQAALQLWHEIVVVRRLAPTKRPIPVYDIANLAEGHCAMQYIGSWGITMLQERYPDFAYGVMPLPIPPGGRPASVLLRWGLAVNAHSPHRDAAAAFVGWALAENGPAGSARVRALVVEGLPIRRSAMPTDAQRAGDPAWRYLLEQIYPHARPGPEWDDTLTAAVEQALDEALGLELPRDQS